MLKEFKEFTLKGNAVDLAVGIVVGAAFTKIVNSLVTDIISPPLGIITGHVNFENLKLHLYNNTSLNYGSFLNSLINFVIVAFAIFLIVKQMNRFRKKAPVAVNEKHCQFCQRPIPILATRCPECTSQLE